ncbi:MAG: autotransporter-associated beta strand repeat-containing protein, partial [Thermoleophilia bacterium]
MQSLGALTLSSGAATIQSTYGTSGNAGLTFASLSRSAGATANFVTSLGANGSTNVINITGGAVGFQNQGLFYAGSDYAYLNAAGTYVRAPGYGTDTNFVTSAGGTTFGGTPTSSTNQQVTGAVTAQTTATINTLKISSASALDFTLAASQTLTLNSGGIIRTGGSTTTLSGGAGLSIASNAEYVINTALAGDALTISNPILANGTNVLTKAGLGTLTLAGANAFTGNIFVNGGVLSIA